MSQKPVQESPLYRFMDTPLGCLVSVPVFFTYGVFLLTSDAVCNRWREYRDKLRDLFEDEGQYFEG
jgi:hypothetical protein